MDDQLTASLRHMKCRTIFFFSPTLTREDVLKRMHMKGVKAVIMVENGYEQHGKMFLQVYNQLATGNDNIHFDDYEHVTIYEIINILLRQSTVKNETHPSPSFYSSFVHHSSPTEPETNHHLRQQYATDLLLQLQQRHHPSYLPALSPQTLDYYLTISSQQALTTALLQRVMSFLPETELLQQSPLTNSALVRIAQQTLSQLKTLGLQPEQEMAIQNYLLSYIQRFQPPPFPDSNPRTLF
ncbi:hypothetical protein BC941DRAFT_505320 [Chlamydoabsidia padenii]|nr:hypothetical protein BC941DRAFT_505320 [Chlamydoabsidia padenii]